MMRLDSMPFAGTDPVADPLETIVSAFQEGAALVDAALGVLAPLAKQLEALRPSIRRADQTGHINAGPLDEALGSIRSLLIDATVSGDNLLIETIETRGATFLVFGLSRQASGAVTTQTIPIERDGIVLMGATPERPRVYDHLVAARAGMRDTIALSGRPSMSQAFTAMENRVAAAGSRLSIVKARVGLQSSFVRAVAGFGMPDPVCRLGSELDQSGIRDLALATQSLLSRKSFDVGSDNRQVLKTLFDRHSAQTAGS